MQGLAGRLPEEFNGFAAAALEVIDADGVRPGRQVAEMDGNLIEGVGIQAFAHDLTIEPETNAVVGVELEGVGAVVRQQQLACPGDAEGAVDRFWVGPGGEEEGVDPLHERLAGPGVAEIIGAAQPVSRWAAGGRGKHRGSGKRRRGPARRGGERRAAGRQGDRGPPSACRPLPRKCGPGGRSRPSHSRLPGAL